MAPIRLSTILNKNKEDIMLQLNSKTEAYTTIENIIKNLLSEEGEFRLSLNHSEDYLLMSSLSVLKTSQAIMRASLYRESNTTQNALEKKINNNTASIAGAGGGAVLGKMFGGGWGAVFGAIAGTSLAQIFSRRTTSQIEDTSNQAFSPNSQADVHTMFLQIEQICNSVDDFIDTYRAQVQQIQSKCQPTNTFSLDSNYLLLLENIQTLVGYEREHSQDEKFLKKIINRIESLAESLENYGYEVVNYTEAKSSFFEEMPSKSVREIERVYPAIIRKGELVLKGKIYIPEK